MKRTASGRGCYSTLVLQYLIFLEATISEVVMEKVSKVAASSPAIAKNQLPGHGSCAGSNLQETCSLKIGRPKTSLQPGKRCVQCPGWCAKNAAFPGRNSGKDICRLCCPDCYFFLKFVWWNRWLFSMRCGLDCYSKICSNIGCEYMGVCCW